MCFVSAVAHPAACASSPIYAAWPSSLSLIACRPCGGWPCSVNGPTIGQPAGRILLSKVEAIYLNRPAAVKSYAADEGGDGATAGRNAPAPSQWPTRRFMHCRTQRPLLELASARCCSVLFSTWPRGAGDDVAGALGGWIYRLSGGRATSVFTDPTGV